MPDTNWVYAFASAIGNGHVAEHIPCQDACVAEDYNEYMISVVADGAGSSENSHFGSKQTVDSCVYFFNKAVKLNKWDIDNVPTENQWHQTAKECLFSVREDLAKFGLSHEMELKSLACTVILVVAFRNYLLVTHIGDGRAGYCNSNLEWHPIISPFHGELANQTVFVTSDIWDSEIIDTYIESRIITGDIKAFCVLSDGCEKAAFECNLYDDEKEMYHDPNKPYPLFFNPNIKILTQLQQERRSQDEINALWRKFLEAGNERLRIETDDKTMILAVNLL